MKSLNDPLDAFLRNDGKVESYSINNSSNEAEQMRCILLWRQDPEESLSDWNLIIESDNMDGCKKTGIGIENLSNEANQINTTFHVHRSILASGSKYFRSLFKKRKHDPASEHESRTSIIKLHPQAINSFPVFLDYIYNCTKGKLGFERSNAVTLRHLAMYFGVDTLLKDVSELILFDFRNEPNRDHYYNDAKIFNDKKLLKGIKLHRSICKALLAVVSGVYSTLSEQPEVILKEDNSVLSSWRNVMTYMCDVSPDAFFTIKNADKYPNIRVTGAGLLQLNGIYKLFSCRDGVGSYTNGFCFLEREEKTKTWFFYVGYYDRESRSFKIVSFYYVESDIDYPPSSGWEVYNNKYLPAPTLISLK